MTNPTFARLAAALLATATVLTHALPAQDVLLSEVRADANGRWIELHNRSAVPVDLSNWSLHYSTHTPNLPQSYWWPFPAGTALAANGFLRVHWYQDATGPQTAGVLWTGTSPYAFLFGLGGEPLQGTQGAFALFATQASAQMSTGSFLVDWVSWGTDGYFREPLAIQQGLWHAGRYAPAIPDGSSLARDPERIGLVAYADQQWFVDNSPTPNLPNVTGAVAEPYGQACVLPGNHLLGAPTLSAPALPLVGSAAFRFELQNTTGIFAEFVVIGFSAGARPAGVGSILPAYAGVPCQESIDTMQLFGTWLLPTQILTTMVPMPLTNVSPAAVGLEFHVQALVVELLPTAFPPYQGISNAVRCVVGQ
ncbi:MAG: lamin tail domain-containing protein [Planctomycetes bacterium]|nr:lamin tail domain-containing protein [Planctomycetota bacterium]